MNQKQIGTVLLIVGALLAVFVYGARERENNYIDVVIEAQGGSCYLEDGTCLHQDRNNVPYIIGWVLAGVLFFLGAYLVFFDKTQEKLAKHQIEVSTALKEARQQSDAKEKFEAFMAGFTPEEQTVLKAVNEQDGIKQSTLRFRTGLSKSMLSLILKSLEARGHVSRKPSGKTNEVFLLKRF